MSSNMSTGQWVGAIAGAVVGFFTGGSTWYATAASMAQGAMMGAAAGGVIDPPAGPQISGPRLSDLGQQGSSYGAPIPRIYGTAAVYGNIFWIENNALKETSATESQGKGGGGAEVTTYTYSATFAIGLCRGPIDGIRRIWISGKLIYDAGSSDVDTIIASNAVASGFTIYNGAADQEANPRMQAALGIANTPAFRGLAYIVFDDLQLADYGNTLMGAQIKVEVMSVAVTSTIITSSASTYSSLGANPSFMAQPVSISADRVTFFSPQWDYSYPAISSFLVYDYFLNGEVVSDRIVVCPGTQAPPIQDLSPGNVLYSALQVFNNSSGYFTASNGIIVERSGLYAGLSIFNMSWGVVRSLHLSTGDPSSQIAIPTNADDSAITTDGTYIYLAGPSQTRIFDRNLTLIASGVGLPIVANIGAPRLSVDSGGRLYALSESGTLFALAPDLSSYETISTGLTLGLSDFYSTNFAVIENTIVLAESQHPLFGKSMKVGIVNMASIASGDASLSSVVQSEVIRSELLASGDIDTATLTDSVMGYRLASTGAIRSGLEPLQAAWPFDVIQSGYKVKFQRRAILSSVATIDAGELGHRGGGDKMEPQLVMTREMGAQLPGKVIVTHLDADREYDVGEQYAERLNTGSINERRIELALVLTASGTAQIAETLLYLYWTERYGFSFTLPPSRRNLEPGDIVTIVFPAESYLLRLTGIQYLPDGSLECTARPHDSIYASTAIGVSGPVVESVISRKSETVLLPLDLPTMLDSLDGAGFLVASTGYTNGWPGAVVQRSVDAGATWAQILAFSRTSTIGWVPQALGDPADSRLIDKASTLNAWLYGVSSLASVSEAQLLNGANHFAYGADGRWEIIAAQNAVLQGDGSYILSDLLRGRFGTEWTVNIHQAYDRIVRLDATIQTCQASLNSIGLAYQYKGVTFGQSLSNVTAVDFTYAGQNLECLSPVYLNGNRHPTSNDWTLTWIRRTRVGGEWRDYVDASLGESSESYEVEIYSSNTYAVLKRTLTGLSTATATYSSVSQIADFGSNQATLYVRIYQLSANVGRGQPLTASITR